MQIMINGIRRDWLPIALIAAYVSLSAILRYWLDFSSVTLTSYFANSFLIFGGIVFGTLAWICARLIIDRPGYPIRHFLSERYGVSTVRVVISALPLIFVFCLFMPHFGALKSIIGVFSAYNWDPIWIEWDYAIHGQDAWKLIQPLLGYPIVTFFLNLAYQVWVLLIYIAFPLACFWRGNPVRRQQMIMTFFLCWIIIGTFMAHWLASVGPCFLEPLTGDNRFREQMDYLVAVDREYPLLVLDVQQRLLEAHQANNHRLGSGISAMPSMHVSVAALFAIFGWHLSRVVGILATLFFVVIFIGSVHLGYHYAVDGYVSIVVTALIWWISGLIVRQQYRADIGGRMMSEQKRVNLA